MKGLQILVLILVLAGFANAQNTVLTGRVYDWQGAVILGIKIKAKDKSGKFYTAKQNDDGVYSVELPKGVYSLEFQSMDFKTFKIKKYRVVKAHQNKMYLDVVLEAGKLVVNENLGPTNKLK